MPEIAASSSSPPARANRSCSPSEASSGPISTSRCRRIGPHVELRRHHMDGEAVPVLAVPQDPEVGSDAGVARQQRPWEFCVCGAVGVITFTWDW